MAAYDRAIAPLAGSAWERPAARSPSAHARRLRTRLPGAAGRDADPMAGALDDLVGLADLAEMAVYGNRPVSPPDVDWADATATRIAAVLSLPANQARLDGSARSDPDGSGEPALSGARPG